MTKTTDQERLDDVVDVLKHLQEHESVIVEGYDLAAGHPAVTGASVEVSIRHD